MQNQKTWGELLQSEMAKAGLNAPALAERCGVERRAVEAWLRGERAPSGSALPRLYNSLRTMRAHQVHLAALRMKLRDEGVSPSEGEPVVVMAGPIESPEPQRLVKVERDPRPVAVAAEVPAHDDEAPVAGAPWSFGQALRRAREAEGLTQRELGETLGACSQKVLRWELDRLSPDDATLADLRKLFPALAGVEPKAKAVSRPGQRDARAKAPKRAPLRGDLMRSVTLAEPVAPGTFGAAVREARLAAGMSQGALARALDTYQGTVSSWEHGGATPSGDVLARLHRVLPALAPSVVDAVPVEIKVSELPADVPGFVERFTVADVPAPGPKADASPLRRWLTCVKAVKGAAYRADLVDLLRLASEAGLGLDDVVDAVA